MIGEMAIVIAVFTYTQRSPPYPFETATTPITSIQMRIIGRRVAMPKIFSHYAAVTTASETLAGETPQRLSPSVI
jgi:hypothetical protein